MGTPKLKFNKEWDATTSAIRAHISSAVSTQTNDIQSMRVAMQAGLKPMLDMFGKDLEDVTRDKFYVAANDGYQIPIYTFTPQKRTASVKVTPSAAILHLHAGGMVAGSPDVFSGPLALLSHDSDVPVFSVDYRLAPEFPHPYPVEDTYSALLWLSQHAASLNIDPARIIIYGESAGGGIAAGVALMARDRDLSPPLAKQILLAPMLDDRNTKSVEALEPLVSWNYKDNFRSWRALLGDQFGTGQVSAYAAPSRAKSVDGLPPTYLDVGSLDIFRDEDMAYAARLAAANIETEVHLYPGLPHGFEGIGAGTEIAKSATRNRLIAIGTV